MSFFFTLTTFWCLYQCRTAQSHHDSMIFCDHLHQKSTNIPIIPCFVVPGLSGFLARTKLLSTTAFPLIHTFHTRPAPVPSGRATFTSRHAEADLGRGHAEHRGGVAQEDPALSESWRTPLPLSRGFFTVEG